jgi:hypothetical protein
LFERTHLILTLSNLTVKDSANRLRKYNERVNQAASNSCAIVFEVDSDFGDIPTLEMKVEKPNTYVMTSSSTRDGCNPSDRVESSSSSRSHDNSDMWLTRNHKITSVLKPDSSDATIVDMQSRDALPSVRIKEEQLCHLSQSQRNELLKLLDECSQCFSDKPGFVRTLNIVVMYRLTLNHSVLRSIVFRRS